MIIKESELIINKNNTVYHLGLNPDQVTDNVIVVGDPDRVELVAAFFDTITFSAQNREYKTIGGIYKNKPVMVISSGIGCGAIDILINELDALVNIDFATKIVKEKLQKLNIIRIGTTGALSNNIDLGDVIMSHYTVGIDSLAHFYHQTSCFREIELEKEFHNKIFDNSKLVLPYAIESSVELMTKFASFSKQGITMCAGGFFAPQGREVRLEPTFNDMLNKLSDFSYNGYDFTNIEMEGAALETLAITLGHKSVTLCVAIAHRQKKSVNIDYYDRINYLIISVLENL